MARYYFNCTGGESYEENSSKAHHYSGSYVCGNSPDDEHGAYRAIVLFNSNDIRNQLSGLRVTGAYLDMYITQSEYSSFTVYIGTHNYTSVPDVWSSSRVNRNRLNRSGQSRGQISMWNLGTTIGTEFKDGVSTGIALGPPPDLDSFNFFYVVAGNGDSREPVLIIDAESINVAPNTPALNAPAASTVIDTLNNPVTFTWTHSDPNGDPQSAYRFRRVRTDNNVTDYWNGSAFVASQTDVVSNVQTLNFNAGAWATDSRYEWTVATRDAAGLWSSYAAPRALFTSVRPTVTVTAPAASEASVRPTIRWTFADSDGDPQYGWSAQIVEPAVYNDPAWNPDNYLRQYWSTSADGTATATAVGRDLRNHASYRAYVKVASSPNPSGGLQWSNWAWREFQVVVPPSASSITFPQNGSVADLAAGFTLNWVNNHYQGIGAQTAVAIRRRIGSTDTYWNGTTWVTVASGGVIPYLPGNVNAYTFRANEVANGQTYSFSVSIRDDYNQVSPWSAASTVEASTAANVTVVAPPAVSVVSNPTVTWTMFDIENDPQQTYQVRIISSTVYEAGSINPGTAAAVWQTSEVVDTGGNTRSVQVGADLDNAGRYRAYVRVRTNGVYSGWSYAEFVVSLVAPGTPMATVNVQEHYAEITFQGRDSMLGDAAARNFADWSAAVNSIVTNAVQFGSSESKYASTIRSVAAGSMTAVTREAWPCTPGHTYTGAISVIAAVGATPVGVYVSIEWLDVNAALVGVSSTASLLDDSAIRTVVTAQAPAAAAYARLRLTAQNVLTANQTHTFFNPVLRPGEGDEWTPGGTLSNTFVSVREVNGDRKIRYAQNVPLPIEDQRVVIRDYEIEMGTQQVYSVATRAVYPNAALVSSPRVLPAVRWVDGWLWLSDPLRPNSGRRFEPVSFDATVRPVRQGKFRPIGRPDAILTTGVRGLREGAFTIIAHDRTTREEFQHLSDFSETILVRIPPDTADPHIADPEGETIYVRFEGDAPEERPLPSRTPHRIIKQGWTEQNSPDEGYEYVETEE